MTAFFRDRRSSWLACVALAFPCRPVWFRSKERGTRVKDREKNRASNCFETTQKRLLRRLLVAARRIYRQYQNQSFVGTWFRFWLQFFRSIKIILKTFGKLCCLSSRLHKLDMQICLTVIYPHCLECFTIIHYLFKLVYSSTIVFLLCFQ